jgi:hypothetical protein
MVLITLLLAWQLGIWGQDALGGVPRPMGLCPGESGGLQCEELGLCRDHVANRLDGRS